MGAGRLGSDPSVFQDDEVRRAATKDEIDENGGIFRFNSDLILRK